MPAGAVCLRQMRDDPSQGRASQAALEVDPSRRRFYTVDNILSKDNPQR